MADFASLMCALFKARDRYIHGMKRCEKFVMYIPKSEAGSPCSIPLTMWYTFFHCARALILLLSITLYARAFSDSIPIKGSSCRRSVTFNNVQMGLFTRWGGPAESGDTKDETSAVDQVMNSMQSFMTNQKLGGLTSNLLQELASATVEGRSDDGKVRIVMNGQQKPIGCQIADESDISTLPTSVTQAMKDAHAKSIALMESKMKSLYDDLGLSMQTQKK
jgi:DNA-binding protein YbaB